MVDPTSRGGLKVLLWWNSYLSYLSHFKLKQEVYTGRKMLFTFFEISFRPRGIQVLKICKLAKWWGQKLNRILIKHDEKRYLNQFVSELLTLLLGWARGLYSCRCVACRIIFLPSFNGLCCRQSDGHISVYIGLSIWHHQSCNLHIFET